MAAALRCVPLAAALLATRAGAYVPGALDAAPHVRLPQGASAHFLDHRGPAPQEHAPRPPPLRMSATPASATAATISRPPTPASGDDGRAAAEAGAEPEASPIRAAKVIDDWVQDASAELTHTRGGDSQLTEIVREGQSVLRLMRARLDTSNKELYPVRMLALATDAGDIQAIAAVTSKLVLNGEEWKEEVDITEIVAKPTAGQQKALVSQLIRQIKDWAAPCRLVGTPKPSKHLMQYYASLILDQYYDSLGSPGRGGDRAEQSPGGQHLHIVKLEA